MIVNAKRTLLALSVLGSMMTAPLVHAEGRLVVYCSATNAMCEAGTKAFAEKYNVNTSFVRNGSGSTLAKIDAEKITHARMFGTAVHLIRNHKRVKWTCSKLTNPQNWPTSWKVSVILPNAKVTTLLRYTWAFWALV